MCISFINATLVLKCSSSLGKTKSMNIITIDKFNVKYVNEALLCCNNLKYVGVALICYLDNMSF